MKLNTEQSKIRAGELQLGDQIIINGDAWEVMQVGKSWDESWVYELVSITKETRLEAPVFMREHTTFTVPVGYEVPQCNCGRTPDYSHTEYTNGFRRFDVYQCGHGGKLFGGAA
jgi:hypothetical protein